MVEGLDSGTHLLYYFARAHRSFYDSLRVPDRQSVQRGRFGDFHFLPRGFRLRGGNGGISAAAIGCDEQTGVSGA